MKNNKLLPLSFILFGLFVLLAFTHEMTFWQAIDVYIMENVPSLHTNWTTSIMLFLAWLGSVKVIAAMTLILIIAVVIKERSLQVLLIPAVVMVGTGVLNLIAKQLINRARPEFMPLLDQDGFSFPSGHTMATVSLCGIIIYFCYLYVKQTSGRVVILVTSIGLSILMGMSRIYLGVHFLTDIIGGFLLSVSWLICSIVLLNRYGSRRIKKV